METLSSDVKYLKEKLSGIEQLLYDLKSQISRSASPLFEDIPSLDYTLS